MLNTNCVKHAYKTFFLFTDDYLDVATQYCLKQKYHVRQAYPFAAALRVLETWKNDLLKQLNEDGVTEERLAENEDFLWMDTEWSPFCMRALHLFETRTFQKTLPRLCEAGYAKQRYIKRYSDGQRVCAPGGLALIYPTYQEAREDKEHPGEIIHQVIFLSDEVNKAIAALGHPQPPAHDNETTKKRRRSTQLTGSNLTSTEQSPKVTDTARGGNPATAQEPSRKTIPHPWQKCEGSNVPNSPESSASTHFCQGEGSLDASTLGKNAQTPSQKNEALCETRSHFCEDPLGKNANNKNLSNKNLSESSDEESLSGAASHAAGDLLSFDFFREYDQAAILDLARIALPLPEIYKSETRQQAALLAVEKAAGQFATYAYQRERGLVHVARLLRYFGDESSPCKWRAKLRQENPGVQIRLWHISEEVARIASQEMERLDWWPAGLSPEAAAPPALAGELMVLDLAELAGIPSESRKGLDKETCLDLVAYLRTGLPPEAFPGVFVDYGSVDRWQRARGYFIEFWYSDGRMLRLYSIADWELIVANADALGTPDFVPRLANALREHVA